MSYGIIYKCTNVLNDKIYIGQTTTALERRISRHLLKNRNDKGIFKRAINKYGKENFKWEVIDKAESKEELDNREIYWIEFYNTLNHEFGYNLRTGGNGGGHLSEETKNKISKIKKGSIPWNLGIPHTEETKIKIGNANKKAIGIKNPFYGKHHSEEAKKNLSERFTGRKMSKEWIEKIKLNSSKGEKNGNNKLTENHVRGMKIIYKYCKPKHGYWKNLAKLLKISDGLIYKINRNEIWKHVEV